MSSFPFKMSAFFNAENLITEIERRPALWDGRSSDYQNKVMKALLWTEVAEALHPDLSHLEKPKKREFEQDIQKRWKGIRSSFSRELQKMKNPPGGPRRPYVHFERLQFLLPVVSMKISNVEDEDRDNPTEEENSTEMGTREWASEGWPSYPHTAKKQKTSTSTSQEDQSLANSNKSWTQSKEDVFDDDKHFLLSLLPELKKVPEDSKLECRMAIMSNIMHYKARPPGPAHESTPPKAYPCYSSSPSPQ